MKNDNLIPVLIIAPFFAPQTHAAMFRVHKLAKYLPEYGYKPIILTTDINYNYNDDPSLIDELPKYVDIVRTRHIEPSLRGLRQSFGGRDRTFKAIKNLHNDKDHQARNKTNLLYKTIIYIYSKITNFLYNIPDAYWTWSYASMKTAEKLVIENDIKIIYTTANPYSHLKIALSLKKKLNVKWLADFRDPCGYGYKNNPNNLFGFIKTRKIIQKTLCLADKVTTTSESYASIFADLYNFDENKITFIPTGIDEKYIPNLQNIKSDYAKEIIFVGEVMQEQDGYILEVIQALSENMSIGLTFIGREEINRPIIEKLISEMKNFSLKISFINHIPQDQLYEILISSKACILAPGPYKYWWASFAKLVDYIGLKVPVIADLPYISEARKELSRAGNGFFISRGFAAKEAELIYEWLENFDNKNLTSNYSERYLARSQVIEFSKIFDQLVS